MKHIKAWHILLIGWVLFLLHAYPGLMTRDSFDQLHQARTGVFSDDHPPLMQALLWITDRVLVGPFALILLQSAMLLGGAYLLLIRVISARTAAITSVALLWFPPVVAVMVVMWKDPLMAGAMLLAVPIITSPRKAHRLTALALIVLSTGVRFNALAATLAIVVLLFEWRPTSKLALRYAQSLGVWIASVAVAFGINSALTSRETHFFHTTLVDDVVGTLYYVDGTRTDSSLKRALEGTHLTVDHDIHAALRRAYRSDGMLNLVVGNDRIFDLPLADVDPPSSELRTALIRAWKTIVFNNTIAWFRYRVDRFRLVIGLDRDDETSWEGQLIVVHDYQNVGELRQDGIPTAISPTQHAIDKVLNWTSHTALFRPYVYLFASLALLWFARRHRIALALLLSGIGIELSLFPLAHSIDYRYSHWLVCTTLIAAVLLFIDRRRRRLGAAINLGAKDRELADDIS